MLSQCFNNDGTPSADIPCDPNALVSACCSERSFCATNLFCLDRKGQRLVGTCSQQDWGISGSIQCPCTEFASNSPFDSAANVTECVNGIYCCGGNNQSCCNSGQGRLSVVYNAFAATVATSPTSIVQPGAMATANTLLTSTTSPSPLDIISSSSPTIHIPTVQSMNFTNNSTGASSSASGSADSGGGDTFGQMGIGVALGLGTPLLLILGACAFLFYRLRETRLQIREVDGPIVRAKRSINTLREKRSMATLNEEDGR